jgi:hypothetical protein
MKQFLLVLLLSFLAVVSTAQVHVSGYTKANGTYVQPYTRSSPDGNPYNNYSYPGNTNPYTGKVATGNPDTYLKNYYNKSATYYVKGSNGESTGAYVTYGNDLKPWVFYNIYTSYGVQVGSIGINNETGSVKIYTLENKLTDALKVSDYYTVTSSTPSYNDNFKSLMLSTNQNPSNPSIASTGVSNSPTAEKYDYDVKKLTPPNQSTYNQSTTGNQYSIKRLWSKIYLKDKDGNYTDQYMIVNLSDDVVTKYTIYNHADVQIGSLSEYATGEKFYYNANGILIRHLKEK